MNLERDETFESRSQRAIDELCQTIRQRYPSTQFTVMRGQDEPANVHLITTVDLNDPEEVLDLVHDRMIEMEVDERIPVYVIPVRTPERILAELDHDRKPSRVRRIHSVVGRKPSLL